MKALHQFFARMPMPLLIGIFILALIAAGSMVAALIWPESMVAIGWWATGLTWLVIICWGLEIAYELITGKRPGRR